MISHWVPAYIADGLAKITGKKAIMLRAYDKVHKASKTFTFFTKREWTVSHTCYCIKYRLVDLISMLLHLVVVIDCELKCIMLLDSVS